MNEKLLKIQMKLKAPKSEFNSFANFSYRSAENILESVKPLAHDLLCTVTLTDEVLNIGDANYVKATATLSDEKDSISVSAYAREEPIKKGMDSAQITGSTSSYARKYALSGLFAIDDNKDADSQDNTNHVSETRFAPHSKQQDFPPKTLTGAASPKQKQLIKEKLEQNGVAIEDMKGYLIEQYGIIDTKNMSKSDASMVIEDLIGAK